MPGSARTVPDPDEPGTSLPPSCTASEIVSEIETVLTSGADTTQWGKIPAVVPSFFSFTVASTCFPARTYWTDAVAVSPDSSTD